MWGQKQKILIDVMDDSPPVENHVANDAALMPVPTSTFGDGIGPEEAKELIAEARREGIKESIKEGFKEKHHHRKKINDLVDKAEKVLLKVRNIVPILADELIIDTNKVTVINRPFFFSEHIQSISIKNINDVFIETMPFLATISIMDIGLPKSHIVKLKWFWKGDAEKARRIITGLMAASKEDIDLKHLKDSDLIEKMQEIGKVRQASTSVSKG